MISAAFELQGSLEECVFQYEDAGIEIFLNQFCHLPDIDNI